MSEAKSPKTQTPIYKKWWFWVIIVVVVFGIGAAAGSGKSDESSTTDPPANSDEQTKEKQDEQEQKPTDGATQEQKNALKKAESYAKVMHMSKQGIYDQLVSEYGEGFSAADAKWAIDHLEGIDWKANALAKAKSYYEQMNMSKNNVYDQLISEYGEKFTPEEAQYAVDNL